jgi:voltage-gated potassium channel
MSGLKEIIEDNDSKWSRLFNYFIEFLILLSLVAFCVGTLPDLSEKARDILAVQEFIIVIIFTTEYILRIIVADNKWKYIISFYGLIDLLAILPFYITAGIDLRALRMFRLFRIFRALKLFRYSIAITRISKAFKSIREELLVFFSATCLLIFLSAVGIYYFENPAQPEAFKSVFHSMWWAVITLTTVGYGDVVPVTVGGKTFTFFILMIGLAIIAVPTGLLTAAFAKEGGPKNDHASVGPKEPGIEVGRGDGA